MKQLLVALKLLRELPAQWMAGPVDQPYLSTQVLLQAIVVGEETLDEWLRRRSSMRWMEGLMKATNTPLRAGSASDETVRDLAVEVVAAASAPIRRAVLTFARSELWAEASREAQAWDAGQGEEHLVWFTRRDEKVCPLSRFLGKENRPSLNRKGNRRHGPSQKDWR